MQLFLNLSGGAEQAASYTRRALSQHSGAPQPFCFPSPCWQDRAGDARSCCCPGSSGTAVFGPGCRHSPRGAVRGRGPAPGAGVLCRAAALPLARCGHHRAVAGPAWDGSVWGGSGAPHRLGHASAPHPSEGGGRGAVPAAGARARAAAAGAGLPPRGQARRRRIATRSVGTRSSPAGLSALASPSGAMLVCGRSSGGRAAPSAPSRRRGGERGRRCPPPRLSPSRVRGRRGFRNRLPCLAPRLTASRAGLRRRCRRFPAPPPPGAPPAAAVPPRGGRSQARCEVQVIRRNVRGAARSPPRPGRVAGREGYFETLQGCACIVTAVSQAQEGYPWAS